MTDNNKVALITGITGQDGAYLAEFLLAKGYTSTASSAARRRFNTARIDHLYQDPHLSGTKLFLHYGDLTDATYFMRIIEDTQPDEIYNLAAQSHVMVSFETPEYTANADGIGPLRLLECDPPCSSLSRRRASIRPRPPSFTAWCRKCRRARRRPFIRARPYGAAKLYAYWITVNYREAYGIHASNGILFNHESPIRGETFVTRKITRAVARIELGLAGMLYRGQSRRRTRLGPCARLCRGRCGASCSSQSPTITCSRPEKHIRCANSSRRRLTKSAARSYGKAKARMRSAAIRRAERCWSKSIRVFSAPRKSIFSLGDAVESARKSSAGNRRSAFERTGARDGRGGPR